MLAPALDALPPLLSEPVLCEWLCFAERRPAYWRTLLQRWRAACGADPDLYCRLPKQMRGSASAEAAAGDDDADAEWLCIECGVEFRTKRALELHRTHKHA